MEEEQEGDRIYSINLPLEQPEPQLQQYVSTRRQEKENNLQSVSSEDSTEHPLAPQFHRPLPPKYLKPISPRATGKQQKSSTRKQALSQIKRPLSPRGLPQHEADEPRRKLQDGDFPSRKLQDEDLPHRKLLDSSSTGDSGKSTLSEGSTDYQKVEVLTVRKKISKTRAKVSKEMKKDVVRDDTANLRKHLMNAIQLKEDNSESVYSYLSANKEYLPLNTMIMTQKKTEGDPFNTVFTETKLESLENVFKDKDTRFKKIFIQGEAGSGKSTFLQKIARDWTRAHEKLENQATSTLNSYEQILMSYFLVLCIPLDKVGDEKRIEDVLSKYVLGKDCPVSPKDCLKLVSKQQANVLFLLDGYDEYSEASNAVAELLQGTLLTDVTIVLTSQSWKLQEPKVSESYDRLIEIKGFKDETAKDFISNFMLSKKIKETDMENIVNQIWTSMDQLENKTSKNPLILLFACVIWLEKSSVPCKRSEIYKDMISCLHDMFTKEVSDVSSKSKQEKIEDDSKPKPAFQGLLVNVGKIAFRCLLSRKQCPKRVPSHWFNEALYQDYLNLALELGLIQETKVIYKQKEVSIAAVVNKSVEEYLAGYYLCNVNDTSIVFHEQAAIIELINAGKIEKSFVYKFLDILTFVSGISPLIACELLSILIPDMVSDSIVMEKLYKCAQEMALLDGLKLPLRCLLFDKNISETLLLLCHETLEYLSFANCQLRGTQNKSDNQVDCGNSQIKKSDNQADGLKPTEQVSCW